MSVEQEDITAKSDKETYMETGHPFCAFSLLQPMNELGSIVDHGSGKIALRIGWTMRAVDWPVAKFGPNAFLRDMAR